MLTIGVTARFKKDLKRMQKRGKDTCELWDVVSYLQREELLPNKYQDHALVGNYSGRRECHIQPDWLLIYKPEPSRVILERTGTHSDLFS